MDFLSTGSNQTGGLSSQAPVSMRSALVDMQGYLPGEVGLVPRWSPLPSYKGISNIILGKISKAVAWVQHGTQHEEALNAQNEEARVNTSSPREEGRGGQEA
eukprot:1159052-Pelagomonas_calceolata.AAC.18